MAEFEYENAGNSEAQQKEAIAHLFTQSGALAATGVLSGLVVSQNTTADGNVLITAGAGVVGSSVTAGASLLVNDTTKTLNIFTANPVGGLPRNDIIVFDSLTALISVIVGPPNATPTDPTVANTALKLARLRHGASAPNIPAANIDDLRVFTTVRGIKPGLTLASRNTDYTLSAGTQSPALLTAAMPLVNTTTACRVVCFIPGFSSTVVDDRVQVVLYDGAGTPCGGGYVVCKVGVAAATTFIGQIAAPAPAGSVTMKAQRVGGTGTVTVRGVEGATLEVIPV